jgi:hypothetical protein
MSKSLVGVAAAVLLAVVAVGPLGVQGTSYNPLTADECPARTMTAGATVLLFHSGSEEPQRSIRPGDVLAVHRARKDGGSEAVGTIRVDVAIGALCFRAAVLEGEVQQHDVARAGSVACLIILSDAPCQREIGR